MRSKLSDSKCRRFVLLMATFLKACSSIPTPKGLPNSLLCSLLVIFVHVIVGDVPA